VPKRDESDPVVEARLRSVLAEPAGATSFEDRTPVAWSELIPSWPDDVDLPSADTAPEPAPPPPAVRSATTTPPPPLSAEGAFAPFDLGRPGVKALAAVAAVIVLIAGFLAWRARPQVDPVAPPPVAVPPAGSAPSGSATADEVVVAVAGKVGTPGLVRLPTGARFADALKAAGGADRGVDPSLLNLARKVVDGELIMVGVTPPPGGTVAAAGPAAAGGGLVNLNTATLADLDGLPGVGPVLAQRILDAREAQGGFRAVADLRKVSGIGGSRFDQIKDLVTV
jgi:competence protein ComEA